MSTPIVPTQRYIQKPLNVEAIEITAENMTLLTEWCKGSIMIAGEGEAEQQGAYIKVKVERAPNKRMTMGFAGDYIVKVRGKFKVYTRKAFKGGFYPIAQTIPVEKLNHLTPEFAAANQVA